MKPSLRFAFLFICACIGAVYLHEIGHAVFGLAQGIIVIPTPAKEYILRTEVEWRQMSWIAVGGPLTTALLTFIATVVHWRLPQRVPTPVLGGLLVIPGLYTVRFLVAGRGHDGLEFQEAQSALGLNPSGHALDILFLVLSAAGLVVLAMRSARPLGARTILNAFGYAVFGLVLLVAVQVVSNLVFDPWFPKSHTLHVPPGLETRT